MCLAKLFSKPKPTGNIFNIGYGQEVLSPQSVFKPGAMTFNRVSNKIEINLDLAFSDIPWTKPPNVFIVGVPDSNSQDGVIDNPDEVLYLEPVDEENQKVLCDWLKPGSDVAYRNYFWTPGTFVFAIHRILRIEFDAEGRKFFFAGVNNPVQDPGFARDKDIVYLQSTINH